MLQHPSSSTWPRPATPPTFWSPSTSWCKTPEGAPRGERPSVIIPCSRLPDPPLPALCSLPSLLPCLLHSTAMLLLAGIHALRSAHTISTLQVLYLGSAQAIILVWHNMVLKGLPAVVQISGSGSVFSYSPCFVNASPAGISLSATGVNIGAPLVGISPAGTSINSQGLNIQPVSAPSS